MFRDFEPQQMNEEGRLGPLKDICVVAAERTYFERKDIDTNPQIVQMILKGELVPHWYYRSDEWVDQPYFIPGEFLQPYRGPASDANPRLYGEGTYALDEDLNYSNNNRFFTSGNSDDLLRNILG